MILNDQPMKLSDGVVACVSSRDDGTMLDRTLVDRHDPEIVTNRRAFCDQIGVDYDDCVYQIINYGPEQTYGIITQVNQPNTTGIAADALYTETPGIGLFLPVADCVATTIYDPARRALALAHLGRHASIAKTMTKVIEYFGTNGSQLDDIQIWMAPSVAADDYLMDYFDYVDDPDWHDFAKPRADQVALDLAGFNRTLALKAGVPARNIERSTINTARDTNYFSHSQGDTAGRFAVVAMMR